jgi:hypothetical protein
MRTFLGLLFILLNPRLCCTKNRIKTLIYKLNGTRISQDFSITICICMFILNLIVTDIIFRNDIIPILLMLCAHSYMSATVITIIGKILNTYIILSLYNETKYLIKTINCRCINDHETHIRAQQ